MAIKPRKVAIIGVGHVGSHCAFSLATQGICDELVLIDIDKPKALAQATDLADATVYLPHHVDVRDGSMQDCKDADVVVISAGPLPKAGQTRVDALAETIVIMNQIIDPLLESGFHGILINISNPCDVITRYLQEKTGFDSRHVIGTSTALDSARLRRVLAQKLDNRSKVHSGICAGRTWGKSDGAVVECNGWRQIAFNVDEPASGDIRQNRSGGHCG